MTKRPLIGVAAVLVNHNKILLGRRLGAHGEGTWAFPGGHLEWFESIENCAAREVREETGMSVRDIEFAGVTNDLFERERKHYITVFMLARPEKADPVVMEPEKCEQWAWFSTNQLPSPRFLSLQNLIDQGFFSSRKFREYIS